MAKKKPKTTRGKKTRAGQLLSQFLRSIAEEKTEVETIDGSDEMVTKAEALARKMWRMGLGYTEEVIKNGVITEIKHPPDKSMIHLLWDRIEGRAGLAADAGDKPTTADKVSEQGKKRIAEAGGISVPD